MYGSRALLVSVAISVLMTNECVFFCAADVSLCGRGNEDDWGRRGHERQAVTSSVRCPPCISSHVSRAVVVVCVKMCMWVVFFLPSGLDLFSAWLHFAPEFQFGMSMGRNTNYAQHNPVSAALLLLNKSQAITDYNPFQIL